MLFRSDPVSAAAFGALEPRDGAAIPPEELDVVIAPGLAFDQTGHRIGYGGGFYDRFLRRAPRALRVGICFEVQLVDAVPAGVRDEIVDAIVTEGRTVWARPARSRDR